MAKQKMIDAILEYGILKIIYEHDWKHIKNENTGGGSQWNMFS